MRLSQVRKSHSRALWQNSGGALPAWWVHVFASGCQMNTREIPILKDVVRLLGWGYLFSYDSGAGTRTPG